MFAALNGRVLIYGDTLSMDEVIVENFTLKQRLKTFESGDTDADTLRTACKVRADIKNMNTPYQFPYLNDFEHSTTLPASLHLLLCNIILSAVDINTTSSPRTQRINSIAADIIYAATAGRIKFPKHILLPYGIKSLTGNVEVIHMLNRLGHGISYGQLIEIQTAIAMQRKASGDILPNCIVSDVFATLAWDNIDKCEETLSGDGTTHRVNGIVIQRFVDTPQPRTVVQPVQRTRVRSFQSTEMPLANYTVVQRVGPGNCAVSDCSFDAVKATSSANNLVWIVTRYQASQSNVQVVPSWTGFNIRVRSDHVVIADNVAYLPPIDSPATSLATVFELLQRSVKIQKQLNLPAILCVFDQALYAKAAEIVWSHPSEYRNVILSLGVFHTICTLLRIIGKRFADAGLFDLLVEGGIVAQGSVSAVLEGRHYNRGIRAHKLVYEALLRIAWKHFYNHVDSEYNDSDRIKIAEALYNISQLSTDLCESQWQSIMQLGSVKFMLLKFTEYLDFLRKDNGSLSAFWMSYVDIINLLLDTVRASREGNWDLHLASIRGIIPWCFAYDHCNYARYPLLTDVQS